MTCKIKHICDECGESVYYETTAYWDADTQAFMFSDDFDQRAYCGDCGAEDCLKVVDRDTGEELDTMPHTGEYQPLAVSQTAWAKCYQALLEARDRNRQNKAELERHQKQAAALSAGRDL